MAKKISSETTSKVSKKEFRKAILEKMESALADYKRELGEKRFSARIKKASKLFSRNLEKLSKKQKAKEKKVSTESLAVAG